MADDSVSLLIRLGDAANRIRDVSQRAGTDEVLDALAQEAQALAAAEQAWAASLDGSAVVSLRSAPDLTAPPSASPPPFADLLAGARPVARLPGYVACALPGAGAAPAGVLVVSDDGMKAPSGGAQAFDLAFAQLALHGGLALEAVRLRERVQSVTRAREALLGSISHDLRNPLNTFAMSAGLLRDDLERNEVDATRGISLVSRMDRATARMQSMIEDLVEASRVDAGKIDLTLRPEGAARLVRDAVAAATPKPPERGATVLADALDEDARVLVDRTRTLQLLAKVIAYAAKSTGDSGSVRLAVTRNEHDEHVRFTARGFGPGGASIPPPPEGRGGLALLLARGLVEAQKGTFRVEAGDTLGVSFTLPAAKA
ncbi:MAG TPA: HAMP domain-containing sensor histidine kinase [Labilithrix sp.]|nr:HAMP domain-containing sensor histidine kinase [Labilithrix sp.]